MDIAIKFGHQAIIQMNNQHQNKLTQLTSPNIPSLQIYIEQSQLLEKQNNLQELLQSIQFINKHQLSAQINEQEDNYYSDYSETNSNSSNESNTADYENDRQKLIIIQMYEIMQDFRQSNRKCVKRCNRKITNIDSMLAKNSLKIKK